MEAKIPFICISNLNEENKIYLDKIICYICKGVCVEPIILKIDKFIICMKCFYRKYNINYENISTIKDLYDKINIKEYEYLFKFKYFCPLCKLNNTNNNVEYEYDDLIKHINLCENQIIYKDLCRCTNIIKVCLKDIDEPNIILENKILEKEYEYEKMSINYNKFKNYLKEVEREAEKENNLNKKKFINKKRNNKNS